MTKAQRERVDALLRSSESGGGATPQQLRDGFAQLMAQMVVLSGVRARDTELGGRPALEVVPATAAASEPSRTSEPPATAATAATSEAAPATPGVILYFHGGAFVFGSPRTALGLTARLVVGIGARALSLDYRLAPEHQFPAAIEDGVRAYRALLEGGIEPGRIAFAGDSAGGNLTITTMLAARSQGLPMPACGLTFSASLDATRSGASMTTRDGIDPVFNREGLERTAQYVRPGRDLRDPLLSPAIVGDLTGLPPLMLQVGTNEVLLDDSVRFAARAAAADVNVILDVTVGVPHVFQSFIGVLDEADRAMERASLFLRQQLPR